MGLMSWLGFDGANTLTAASSPVFAPSTPTATRGVVSPFAGGNLSKIVIDDLFGLDTQTVSRAEAMSVPAVKKARDLIALTLARQPLKAFKEGVEVPVQPTWLTRTNGAVGPRMRMLWTIDDCLFYGWSLWATERGVDNQLLDALRVPPDRWQFDALGQVEVADEDGSFSLANSDDVILIPGPSEGLLVLAARTVRAFRSLENAWQSRVSVPLPTTEIRYTGDETLTKPEMAEIRDTYIEARRDTNGAVMVTPAGFEVHVHSIEGLDLFDEGRNSATLDIARFTNLPAAMLDASNVNASSVNYANNAVKRNEFHDITLRSWALSIEERLSMDDCVPRGTYMAFDLSALIVMPDPGTGPVLED